MATLISGSRIAKLVNEHTKSMVAKLIKAPLLATILVHTGNVESDKANQLYVHMKATKAKKLGIKTRTFILRKNITQNKLLEIIKKLNNDKRVSGILVQLPLPKRINEDKIEEAIRPDKDVDGVNPINIGKLATNVSKDIQYYPTGSTPTGIITMLNLYFHNKTRDITLKKQYLGKRVVILGRSNIVGRPLALMLINNGCEVTVLNHKFANDKKLKMYTKHADIIISATGHYHSLTSNDLGENEPVLIDAGEDTNPHTHKLCGDISDKANSQSEAHSSVPHGVGPMTIATLLRQVYKLSEIQQNGKD